MWQHTVTRYWFILDLVPVKLSVRAIHRNTPVSCRHDHVHRLESKMCCFLFPLGAVCWFVSHRNMSAVLLRKKKTSEIELRTSIAIFIICHLNILCNLRIHEWHECYFLFLVCQLLQLLRSRNSVSANVLWKSLVCLGSLWPQRSSAPALKKKRTMFFFDSFDTFCFVLVNKSIRKEIEATKSGSNLFQVQKCMKMIEHAHHLVWSWSERTAESEGNEPGRTHWAKQTILSGHTHCDDVAALVLPRRLLRSRFRNIVK